MRRYAHSLLLLMTILLISGLLIGFESAENNEKVCDQIIITIDNRLDNHFVNEEDIFKLITAHGTVAIEGTPYSQLNLRKIERRLYDEPFLSEAEIYVDHSGAMMVNVAIRRPMARIVRYDRPDAYIGEDGQILPIYDKYRRRTLLVTGDLSKDLIEQENIASGEYGSLYNLIQRIITDKFLNAQIAQIKLLENGEVILYPQVTKQYIEFGKIEEIESKFNKLRLFYKDILPRKGWNYYSRVSLKYKNQIICE